MDMDETCIPKELPVKLCKLDVNSGSGSNKCEINSVDGKLEIKFDKLQDCTNNKEENSKRFIKESRLHLLTDSDDSFEIFQPKKNSTLKASTSLPPGKQKSKKTTLKSRSCPYFSTKSVKSYFKSPRKTKEEKDLELAIKRSLLDVSVNSQSPVELSSEPEANQIKTKSKSPLKLKKWTGKSPKKQSKSILKQRTTEDRSRIITQKVAIVLLEKKEVDDCPLKRDIQLTSSLLEEHFDKNSKLWELSKLSVDCYISDFYVKSLQSFLELPSSSVFYSNLLESNMEDLPSTSEPREIIEISQDDTEDISPLPRTAETNISHNNIPLHEITFKIPENTSYFETSLESLKIVSDNLYSLYNNQNCSDLHFILKDGFVHGHKLILHIRCPKLLEDLSYCILPNIIDLTRYSKNSAVVFLEYIYSGRTMGIYDLSNDEKIDVLALSKKYELPYLENLLLSSTVGLDDVYNQSTCSPPSESRDDFFNIDNETQDFNEHNVDLNKSSEIVIVEVKGSVELSSNSVQIPPLNVTPKKESYLDTSDTLPLNVTPKRDSSLDLSDTLPLNVTPKKESYLDTSDTLPLNVTPKRDSYLDMSDRMLLNVTTKKDIDVDMSDTLPLDVTPKTNSNVDSSLTRPFSIFSKSIVDMFEHSFNSPVTNQTNLENNMDSEVIHIVDTPPLNKTLARKKSPEFSSAKRRLLDSNSPAVLINDACHSNSSVKDDIKKSPLVILLDSDSNSGSRENNEKKDSKAGEEFNTCNSEDSQATIIYSPGSAPDFVCQYSPNNIDSKNEEKAEFTKQISPLIEELMSPDLSSTPKSTPFFKSSVENKFETPKATDSSLIIKDATPRPNYQCMTATELKLEMSKYGLNPNLSRQQIIRLLQYIYGQLHLESSEPINIINSSKDKGISNNFFQPS